MTKNRLGNYFEDFYIGQEFSHATPRTLSSGDQGLYSSLYGTRFAVHSSTHFAQTLGYPRAPLDDFLVFHVVFGKTVPDISLNAIANLGYADCRFLKPVFPSDTLRAFSKVIGLKENSDGKTGVVYVRSWGVNQKGEEVLTYMRWVMVRKRGTETHLEEPIIPEIPQAVLPEGLGLACPILEMQNWDTDISGSPHKFEDYEIGEKIDHIDAMTVEEAEHMIATRLYQNTAKVHFNQFAEKEGRFGRRIIYGGHVISLARALSFNGLANAFHVTAINGGKHIAPLFAGDTVFAWSQVLEKTQLEGRLDVGALRVRTIATKDLPCNNFPERVGKGYEEGVVLDLDYWVLMPS